MTFRWCASVALVALCSCREQFNHDLVARARQELPTWGERRGDLMIIRFVTPGECSKCDLVTSRVVDSVRAASPSAVYIAALRCESGADLLAFRARNAEFDAVIGDMGDLRARTGLPLDARMALLDRDGRLLASR